MTGQQTMNMDPAVVFIRLGQTLRGWTDYYHHGASKIAFSELDHYLWHRVEVVAPTSPASALEMDRPHLQSAPRPVGFHR